MEYFIGTYGQTAPNYYGFNIEAVGQNYDVEIDTPQVASTGQGGTAILCQGYISDNKFVCG